MEKKIIGPRWDELYREEFLKRTSEQQNNLLAIAKTIVKSKGRN
jgi:hypothetical protein